MNKHRLSAIIPPILAGLLLVSFLAACAPATPQAPTQDPNIIATQAVRTYEVGQTASAVAKPSETPAPSETTVPLKDTPTAPAEPGEPTATYYIAPEDKASFVSQIPLDGAEIGIGDQFRVIWTVRNDGKTTWTTAYSIRYFSGANLGLASVFYFPHDVAPGEEVKLVVNMKAPNYAAQLSTNWVLTNGNGDNFYPVYFEVKIVNGPTVTPTPTSTYTPTPGPSPTKVIG